MNHKSDQGGDARATPGGSGEHAMQAPNGITGAFTQISLSALPIIISLGATFLLSVSVSYHLGFLSAIDIGLATLFSLQDTLLSTLSLIPLFVLILPTCVLGFLGTDRIVRWLNRRYPSKGKFPPKALAVVTWALGIACGFIAGLGSDFYAGWGFAGMLMWMAMIFLVRPGDRAVARITASLVLLMIIMVLTFVLGGMNANARLIGDRPKYVLQGKDGVRCIKMLRAGSAVLIVQEIDQSVSIIPTSQIVSLARVGTFGEVPDHTLEGFKRRAGQLTDKNRLSERCPIAVRVASWLWLARNSRLVLPDMIGRTAR